MPKIDIDGVPLEVGEGRNVLQAALDHGLDLPYFCWHPAMGSVGACRLCAVKQYRDETDDQGRLVMGCMTPATEGTRVSIADAEAGAFRRSVIEWLMINHPHDCPVCDEGGECHLQDMTVMTGHSRRRYRGRKRTYTNQYLGPLIHHEMNRCIQCYRCVRFYCDHSGGDDLGAFASRDRVYFGRVEEGVLESPFSGNLVEVCPTGVFTDKTYRRHYTRKWDLESAPSLCSQCGLGCNTIVGARYGTARRVTSRYNGAVNGYWICDRGRFGYEFAALPDRPRAARGLDDSGAVDGLAAAARAGRLAAVGSPRASLETNFALRTAVGRRRFCAGIAAPARRLLRRYLGAARSGAITIPSLQQIEGADAIFVLGTDLTHEAPLLDLAVFRAVEAGGARLFVAGLGHGRVAGFAEASAVLDPERAAGLAAAVARRLTTTNNGGELGDSGVGAFVGSGADALAGAAAPLIVCGTQQRSDELLDAALELTAVLGRRGDGPAAFALAVAEANDMGAALLDGDEALGVDALVDEIESGAVRSLLVCENDLFERCPDPDRLAAALERLDHLVVVDHLPTATADLATHFVPAATTAESTGTLVNNECRIQRFFQVLRPPPGAAPSWSIIRDLTPTPPSDESLAHWSRVEDVTAAMSAALPELAAAVDVAPAAGFRYASQAIPRMSHRVSGRNATPAADALRDPDRQAANEQPPDLRPPGDDPDSPLRFSMEGYGGAAPPTLMARIWSPGWNSNESINQFQIEVGGPLHGGDPGRRIFGAGATDRAIAGDQQAAGVVESRSPAAGDGGGGLLICAVAEIFGSEPTSRRSPAIAELSPAPYLRLHPARAAALGLDPGAVRRLELVGTAGAHALDLEVHVDPNLPEDVALLPAGYVETRWWQEPVRMRVEPTKEAAE